MQKHYIYIVECNDKSLYTGYSLNVEKRVEDHNAGRGAKSIRGKLPVRLVHFESFKTKKQALSREIEIKKWPRERKLRLVSNAGKAAPDLSLRSKRKAGA